MIIFTSSTKRTSFGTFSHGSSIAIWIITHTAFPKIDTVCELYDIEELFDPEKVALYH